VHFFWVLSLLLEMSVYLRGLRAAWKAVYPGFMAYLALDLIGSLILFGISLASPHAYDIPWRAVTILMGVLRIQLVVESYVELARSHPWRLPMGLIVAMSLTAALIIHRVVAHAYRWPGSSLESVYSFIATINALLGFIMLGVLCAYEVDAKHNRGLQHWHARILCAYLLLTVPAYYAASQHPWRIGSVLMIIASVCYGAWLFCVLRFSGSKEVSCAG